MEGFDTVYLAPSQMPIELMKNISKQLSYTEAWRRINAATEAGFDLEAITIGESIISDRLLSYVMGVEPSSQVHKRSSLSQLITLWRKLAGASLIKSDGTDLGKTTDEWRIKRNQAVHGLVKSSPRSPPIPLDDFFALARQAAEEGKMLAREIQNWHRRELRKTKSWQSLVSEDPKSDS
jgi:hypothetical protein